MRFLDSEFHKGPTTAGKSLKIFMYVILLSYIPGEEARIQKVLPIIESELNARTEGMFYLWL